METAEPLTIRANQIPASRRSGFRLEGSASGGATSRSGSPVAVRGSLEVDLQAESPPGVHTPLGTLTDTPVDAIASDRSALVVESPPDFPIPPPRRLSGKQFDPAHFIESASVAIGTHGFAVSRQRLINALAAALAFTGQGTKQENTVKIVLARQRIKLAAYARKTDSFFEYEMETVGEIDGLSRDADPVAFYIGLGRLQRLVSKSRKGEPVRFVLDPRRGGLRMPDKTGRVVLPLGLEKHFTNYHSHIGRPTFVQLLASDLLVTGLQMAGQFVRTDHLKRHSLIVRIGDGRIEAVKASGSAYVMLQAKKLEGLTALIAAKNVLHAANAIMHLDPSNSALFDTPKYHLLADSQTCIGLPKIEKSVPALWPKIQGKGKPLCRLFVPRDEVRYHLARFAANVPDQRDGGSVRLHLWDMHSLVLQIRDGWDRSRGVAKVPCHVVPVGDRPRRNVPFLVNLRDFASALAQFDSRDAEMVVTLNDSGAPRALQLQDGDGRGDGAFSASTFLALNLDFSKPVGASGLRI
jgi:hypothetical protein